MMVRKSLFYLFTLVLIASSHGKSQETATETKVPGVVVAYQPAFTKQYIGSPSLTILPNGDYVASHDFFGPNSSEYTQAKTNIYTSKDRGKTWGKISTIRGAFWSSLFVHRGDLYLLGPDRHHGTVLIRKSTDGGITWTQPVTRENGMLVRGQFHCAPMPVIEHKGRLWRPMETAHGPDLAWGKRYGAMVMSAPVDADLLKSESWQISTPLLYDSTYLNGNFGGWLEGNFVVDREGRMWDMLRVDDRSTHKEKAAVVKLLDDGEKPSFDPETGFIDFPGGSKKFVVKYDEASDHYWTLVNTVSPEYSRQYPDKNPTRFRNVLMLRKSKDLFHWEDVKIILERDEVLYHGFQYVDWVIEEKDMLILSRTAHFDGQTNAHNSHDANFLTFHRIRNFRNL